ncbi:MAG TPA: transaminase [Solirubrobacteraceae bacterium]|nr:transaminase [Solirubrobacteraceae bacterium]
MAEPLDRARITELLTRERERFDRTHATSRELHEQAHRSLLNGVPMTWMAKWPGGHPVYATSAHGATITDVDGNAYIDFALGDTGAMAGHSPRAMVDAATKQLRDDGGATIMLPTVDAAAVGDELAHRFGLPLWSFSLSATDANRWALRLTRAITGRRYVAVFSHSYHGTVDESFVTTDEHGNARTRRGNVGPAVDPTTTTRVCEFNDLDALERILADGQVAALLMEPAMTNIGIVLPEPGYLEAVRELCTRTGTLLINDETHTLSAGPGGCTAAWGLTPDLVTIGKSIAGGVPIGAYGISADVARRIEELREADLVDVGGVGGTLAGNPLSVAAARATLEHVLTDDAFAQMIALCDRFTAEIDGVIAKHGLPWCIVQLGARAELMFTAEKPRTGNVAALAHDDDVEELLHLYLLNRGVIITPFHNMSLMSPATTADDVAVHVRAFAELAVELSGAASPNASAISS